MEKNWQFKVTPGHGNPSKFNVTPGHGNPSKFNVTPGHGNPSKVLSMSLASTLGTEAGEARI